MTERLHGMAEAERLMALAQRLFETAHPDKRWAALSMSETRPWIDKACATE